MTFVGEHRDIIPHLHKSQIDQLPEMIRVDRKQCPLRLDVPKRPNGVDGPKGADPRYVAPSVIHYIKSYSERNGSAGATEESPTEAALMIPLVNRDLAIGLPELYVVAVNQLLGALFGSLAVSAKQVNAFQDVPL